MKRLIALIGAVATAFGLYADPVEYYANSFETTTEGLSQDGTTWSAATPWSTELTDAFKVEAYGQGEPGVYSDVAALLLLGSLVDAVISLELSLALQGQPLGDSGGQGGLAVVDVTDGTDVNMGLGSFKFLLYLQVLIPL